MARFLNAIQREESFQFSELVGMRSGAEGPRQRKEDVERTARLQRMANDYSREESANYLRSVTYNITMNE